MAERIEGVKTRLPLLPELSEWNTEKENRENQQATIEWVHNCHSILVALVDLFNKAGSMANLKVVDLKAQLKPLDNAEITNAFSKGEIEIMSKSGYAEVIGRMLTAVVLAQCRKAKDRGFRKVEE